jgi:hypothetical protein
MEHSVSGFMFSLLGQVSKEIWWNFSRRLSVFLQKGIIPVPKGHNRSAPLSLLGTSYPSSLEMPKKTEHFRNRHFNWLSQTTKSVLGTNPTKPSPGNPCPS